MENDERFSERIDENISSLDAYFTVTIDEDGVLLTVFPPQGTGKPVKEPQIIEYLAERGINTIDKSLLLRVIKEALGTPVKITEKPEKVEPDIRVVISRDRMEAVLQVIMPKGCRHVSLDEILSELKNKGITYGIDNEAMKTALERPGRTVVCARGLAAVDGTDASIKYFKDFDNRGRPVELEGGLVDFKNINLFITVQKDELLAEKILPTLGIAGIDVLGNKIPAKPGKDLVLPKGKNVYSVDGLKLYAGQAGQVVLTDNKVNIIPVIEVNGDVDLSTGNINFTGNVVVKGSIQTGFTVKAEGDVEIFGNVCGGTVEGKNITVRMGIQGMQKGYIRAKKNVVAKYIENASVHAGENIIVDDVIMHSKVSAAKKVMVQEGRGLIVGGQISAGEEIRTKTIGTSLATRSYLKVGVSPELREEYRELKTDLQKTKSNLEETKKALNILKTLNQRTMSVEKREKMLKLMKNQFHLIGQIETMRNRLAEIEISFEKMKSGYIRVSEVIYPGVVLVIGTLVKPINDIVKFANFFVEGGEISIEPYK